MPIDSPLVMAYFVFVASVLGLCMGSFLNCLAWRMTHGESVLHGRSHCTSCGHVLGARDLVPVFSWLFTRGTCRYCGERVSARYPAIELLCAVVYASILLRYGIGVQALELMAFASVLLVLSLTDLDDYVIPNATIVAAVCMRLLYLVYCWATGSGVLLALVGGSIASGLVVAVPRIALVLIMDRVLGKESFGGGDIKLRFVAGMYFGWRQCLFLVLVACVLGIAFGVLGHSGRSKQQGAAGMQEDGQIADAHLIPFGPSIAVACWITMLVGQYVLDWYAGLFIL